MLSTKSGSILPWDLVSTDAYSRVLALGFAALNSEHRCTETTLQLLFAASQLYQYRATSTPAPDTNSTLPVTITANVRVAQATIAKGLSFLHCLSALSREAERDVDTQAMTKIMANVFDCVGEVVTQLLYRAKDEADIQAEDSARQVQLSWKIQILFPF